VYKEDVKHIITAAWQNGAETWSLCSNEELLLERTELRMLRRILGVSLKDKRRNEDFHREVRVACINVNWQDDDGTATRTERGEH